jgi:hypothetical protein
MSDLITGLRHTANINQTRRKYDVSDRISLLQPNKAPLTVLLRKLAKKTTINPIFHWFEDDLQPKWDAVDNTGGYSASDTSIVVDRASLYNTNDLVKVPRTGEVMLVTAVDSATNTLTVQRGIGETDPAALVDDDPLVIIGNAHKEGSLAPEAKGTVVETIYNYTQIFRTTVKVTKTQEASELYGGSDRMYQRRKKAIEHAVDIERAFLFGERSEDLTGSEPRRTTRGVVSFLIGNTDNILDVSSDGKLSEALLEEFFESLFRYGSSKKVCFASARLISIFNTFGRDKIHMKVGEDTFGIKVMQYISAHGELQLIKHHLLEGSVYGKCGIILDLEEDIKYRPLKGRDTMLNIGIQPPDADYYLDEYLTEAGLELRAPKKHGLIIGANEAVVA